MYARGWRTAAGHRQRRSTRRCRSAGAVEDASLPAHILWMQRLSADGHGDASVAGGRAQCVPVSGASRLSVHGRVVYRCPSILTKIQVCKRLKFEISSGC